MYNLGMGLVNLGHEVKILAITTPKHFIDQEQIPGDYKDKTQIELSFIDTRVKILPALLNLFSKKSYNIERFYSPSFENKLIAILKQSTFDVIQLESLFVSPYLNTIRKHSTAKVILRSHNVEFRIWERLAMMCKNPIKKTYLSLLARKLKNYEINLLNKYDAIAAITPLDAALYRNLGFKKSLIHIPFGINTKLYINDRETAVEFPSLFHLGSMDWEPNLEAITWFLDSIWNPLKQKHPSLKVYLAGKNMPQWIKNREEENLIVTGEIKNSKEFMQSKSIMIVPLLSGGGMRVKIIEGMAMGKTIISTTIGAEGIACENNKSILIADTAVEFIDAISKCISDPAFCLSIGENSSLLVNEFYDNSKICNRLVLFYNELLNK